MVGEKKPVRYEYHGKQWLHAAVFAILLSILIAIGWTIRSKVTRSHTRPHQSHQPRAIGAFALQNAPFNIYS